MHIVPLRIECHCSNCICTLRPRIGSFSVRFEAFWPSEGEPRNNICSMARFPFTFSITVDKHKRVCHCNRVLFGWWRFGALLMSFLTQSSWKKGLKGPPFRRHCSTQIHSSCCRDSVPGSRTNDCIRDRRDSTR